MWQMINLRELIKFSDWLKDSLSSCQKKLCSEMKDLTQKLWNSCSMRDKLKISSSEEIHHVALNENESETVNDLLMISCQLHHSHILSLQLLFLMWLSVKMKNNSEILRESVRVLIIASLTMRSLTQFIIKSMYFLKERSLNWMS